MEVAQEIHAKTPAAMQIVWNGVGLTMKLFIAWRNALPNVENIGAVKAAAHRRRATARTDRRRYRRENQRRPSIMAPSEERPPRLLSQNKAFSNAVAVREAASAKAGELEASDQLGSASQIILYGV
jgi:hypothetical protein